MEVSRENTVATGAIRDLEENSKEISDLVRRAQKGDLPAIQALYLGLNEQIYRFIWSRVHDPALADDLTGEVFLRMVARLPTYQDRALPFRAWLYRITRNLVIDNYRRNQNKETVPLESIAEDLAVVETPESTAELRLTFERAQKALESLAPEQREVVELRFMAGLTLKEVALAVDKSVQAVKGLQHRGLTALRDYLKE